MAETRIEIVLEWDGKLIGWKGTATGRHTHDGVEVIEATARHEGRSDYNPIWVIALLVDQLCFFLDTHPRNVTSVDVNFPADGLDAMHRFNR